MILETSFVTLLNGEVIVYDTKTNVNLAKYVLKGAQTKCSALLPQNLLLVCDQSKPAVHVFPLSKGEPDQGCKITLPAKPETICSLPDGSLVVVSIKNGFYLWHSGTNKVQHGSKKHFRSITVIKSNRDGSLFATGAEDGIIYVWKTSELLADLQNGSGIIEPFMSLTDHTLPVKDLTFGNCLKKSILISTSVDRTFRVYDLSNKRIIFTLILNIIPSTVKINRTDGKAFIGNVNGEISAVTLAGPSNNTLTEFENSSKKFEKFSSYHSKELTCLELATSNKILYSGSKDGKLVTWSIPTKQLLHVLDTKSEIIGIDVRFISKQIFSQDNPSIGLLRDTKEVNSHEGKEKVIAYHSTNDISDIFNTFKSTNKQNSFTSNDKNLDLEKQLTSLMTENQKMFDMIKDILLTK